METNNGIILSLLRVFAMFELRLNFDEEKLDVSVLKEKQVYI